MIFNMQKYFERMNACSSISLDREGLFKLHEAHFYNIPFENFEMSTNKKFGLDHDYIFDRVITQRKGGICYETCLLMALAFDEIGFKYRKRLARVHAPVLTPATHQVFIVELDSENWLFDVGFGAKGPRAPLLLQNGYLYKCPFHSTKITADKNYGWIVSVKENIKPDAEWELIYSFYDLFTTNEDIEMSYYYTVNSNKSLLNTNKVISLPIENGRISIRNKTYTEVQHNQFFTRELESDMEVQHLIRDKFGIDIKIN